MNFSIDWFTIGTDEGDNSIVTIITFNLNDNFYSAV